MEKGSTEDPEEESAFLRACVGGILGGVAIGLVGAVFRLCLFWLGEKYRQVVTDAHSAAHWGWLLPVLLSAVGAGLARWVIRSYPVAAGSGVQHLEGIVRGEAAPSPSRMVPLKFLGGLLGLGTGLALGREGPTIQMGATMANTVARWLRCGKRLSIELQAALGGAGLAVAFNAPMGGTVFVFEEVTRSFKPRLMVVALISTATAIAIARLIIGSQPDFQVVPPPPPPLWTLFLFGLLGGLLGVSGVLYNKLIIAGLNRVAAIKSLPFELRAALVGCVVGGFAWFFPSLVGPGDNITQGVLHGTSALMPLLPVLALRWVLGPLSYSAGTPGGLFSPLLVVGAVFGAAFAHLFDHTFPEVGGVTPVAFAVVGMSAFFTAVVRAPLTGVILITEMTGVHTLMAPLLAASFGAMLTASLAGGPPIYDTLRERMKKPAL